MSNIPLVIGHRGAMGHETENSLASIQKALDLDVDMIEIDVFEINSGEIVVFHDVDVVRLTNGKGKIEGYNMVDLKKLVLDNGHTIPQLRDVLELVDRKTLLNIELKGANTAKKIMAIINEYISEEGWSLEDFLISSFNWDELYKMRELNKKIAIAILTEEDPLDAIPIAHELKAKAINPDFEKLTLERADKIRQAGFKIYAWTVNEPKDIVNMKRIGVDGIITNYPERIN